MTRAEKARYAARNRFAWGRYATLQYVLANNILRLYRLACQLEATKPERTIPDGDVY